MKKTFFFLLMLSVSIANAQSWNLTGNTGTSNTNFLGTTDAKDLVIKTNNNEKMRIYSNGNIDFTSPYSTWLFPFEAKYKFYGNTTFSIGESAHSFVVYSDPQNASLFRIDGDYMNIYLQEDGGNVIIGSPNNLGSCSSCSGYRLFVKDGIKTEKVKVEIAAENGWADYVFKKDYQLMPLNQLAKFIDEKGHLPEVPTTEEAIENGIELKEMNILLLKKVEELTLYIIELNKSIEELKRAKQ